MYVTDVIAKSKYYLTLRRAGIQIESISYPRFFSLLFRYLLRPSLLCEFRIHTIMDSASSPTGEFTYIEDGSNVHISRSLLHYVCAYLRSGNAAILTTSLPALLPPSPPSEDEPLPQQPIQTALFWLAEWDDVHQGLLETDPDVVVRVNYKVPGYFSNMNAANHR
jgi:hypothetical protein